MAAPNRGSRVRMLDEAERLFAERGYDATHTREIVARSGGTLGTFSYHFKSKHALLVEVVRRRFDDLGDLRLERYQSLLESAPDGQPTLEDVIDCIITPFLERAMCGGPEWRSYIILLCRLMYGESNGTQPEVAAFTDAVGKVLLGWLRQAAPAAAPSDLAYAYQFTIATMVDSATQLGSNRLSRLTDGECRELKYEDLRVQLLRYTGAGVRAVLGLPPVTLAEGARPDGAEARTAPMSA